MLVPNQMMTRGVLGRVVQEFKDLFHGSNLPPDVRVEIVNRLRSSLGRVSTVARERLEREITSQ